MYIPYERNMYAHVPMDRGTVKTDVDSICNAGPRRVSGLTVKARLQVYTDINVRSVGSRIEDAGGTHLVSLLILQNLEDSIGLCFCRFRHIDVLLSLQNLARLVVDRKLDNDKPKHKGENSRGNDVLDGTKDDARTKVSCASESV